MICALCKAKKEGTKLHKEQEETYVRSELEVRDTSLDILIMGVVEMTVDDLLGEGEWSVKPDVSYVRDIFEGVKRDVMATRTMEVTTTTIYPRRHHLQQE